MLAVWKYFCNVIYCKYFFVFFLRQKSPPWLFKIAMACLRIIFRDESQTVVNSPECCSSLTLNTIYPPTLRQEKFDSLRSAILRCKLHFGIPFSYFLMIFKTHRNLRDGIYWEKWQRQRTNHALELFCAL